MEAAVNMPGGVCPEHARGTFEYVGSQYIAQMASRRRFTTHFDDLRLVHPLFNESTTATQRVCRIADNHKDTGAGERKREFSET